jgi:hypothetical protein
MTETFGHVYRMHMQGDTLVAAGIYRGGLFKPFFALFNTEGDSIGGKVFYAGAMPFDVARDEQGNTYLAGAVSFNFTNSNCDSPPLMPTWDGFMIKEGPCQATPPPAPQLQLHCRTINILNEGYCIEWLRDGISMGSVNSLEVRASGKYEVIFTNGCDVSASTVIEIDIDTLMTEPVQPIVQQNCRELQIENSTPTYTITWTKNNLTIPDEHSATLAMNSAGSYKAIFHNACGSTSSSIAVNQNSFQTQIPQLKVECDVIEIINSNDIGNFEWFKDGNRLFYTSPVLRVVESGEYMVLSNNACGALQSETISLSVPDEGVPELYNIISPNGDGKNDLYEVKDYLRGSGLLVVNRWGKVVYTSQNYQNDWGARDVAPGIYFYTINNQCFGQFKGTLTIKQ